MRKVISLMMVLVLGVVVMGTSANAVCPGPNAVTATMTDGRPTPSGDDGGWDDPQTSPATRMVILLPTLGCLAWFIDWPIFDLIINSETDVDSHGSAVENEIDLR